MSESRNSLSASRPLEPLLLEVDETLDELATSRRIADATRASVALLELRIRLEAAAHGRRSLERAHALVGATGPVPTSEAAEAARAQLVDEARHELRRCPICGFVLAGLREDAVVCSDRCRARLHRRRHAKGDL